MDKNTLNMLITSVENTRFRDVYDEWCAADLNRVVVNGQEVRLTWAPGLREHPLLVSSVSVLLHQNGIETKPARNWKDRTDRRVGVVVTDTLDRSHLLGTESFRVLAHTPVELWVRVHHLLHLLGVTIRPMEQP